MKLLLVDDDSFLRDMYALKFIESGHTVDAVCSAEEALRFLKDTSDVDVVVLDMVMPGMTGLELLATVSEQQPEFTGEFIMLSNQGENEDVKAALAAGARGYIIKAEAIPSDVVAQVETLMKHK